MLKHRIPKSALGWMLAGVLGVSGCAVTHYYRTEDVNARIDESITQVESFVAKAVADYNDKASLFAELETLGTDLQREPYPTLQADLDRMKAALNLLQQEEAQLEQRREALRAMIADRREVNSEDPAYSEIESFQTYLDGLTQNLEQRGRAYQEASQDFAAHSVKAKIGRIEVAGLRDRVGDWRARIEQAIADAEAVGAQVKSKLAALSGAQRRQNVSVRKETEAALKAVAEQRKALANALAIFEADTAGRESLMAGPHLKSHGIEFTLETVLNEVRYQERKLNALLTKVP